MGDLYRLTRGAQRVCIRQVYIYIYFTYTVISDVYRLTRGA